MRWSILSLYLALSLIFVSPVFASQETEYKEVVNIVHPYMIYYKIFLPNQTTFSSGDSLPISLYLKNIGAVSVPELYFVIDLSQGCQKTNTDCYNLFYEKKITTSLDRRENKTIKTNIKLPEDLVSGNYTLSFYLRSPRYDIYGVHPSYEPFKQYSFSVKGRGVFPSVKILPRETSLGMAADQRGPTVYKNVSVEGYFSAENLLDRQFNGIVKLFSCPYDDQGYFSCKYLKEYNISIPPKGRTGFLYEITTNQDSDAYALRFELMDQNGRVHSIWKSRYIVNGEDASILTLTLDKFGYHSGEEVLITLYITGPFEPSYIREAKGVSVKVSIQEANETIFTDSKIDNFTEEFAKKVVFKFKTPVDLNNYKLCAETFSSSGNRLDKICHDIVAPKPKKNLEPLYIFGIIVIIMLIVFVYFIKRK